MPKQSISIAGKKVSLDARPDRIDLRDLPYRPPPDTLEAVFPSDNDIAKLLPSYTKAGLILDQGQEGACTGFGLAAVINYLLWRRSGSKLKSKDKVSMRMLYHLARFYDEWEGEDYEGSSCRGALKGWHRHGVCMESNWSYIDGQFKRPLEGWDEDAIKRPLGVYYRINAQSVVDMQAAIFHTGSIYVSADVHKGWYLDSSKKQARHKSIPVIQYPKNSIGGHAFAIVGYNDIGFIVQNSWNKTWGLSGFAILSYEDWVENGSDAWVVALGAPVSHPVVQQNFGRQAAHQFLVPQNSPIDDALNARKSKGDPLGEREDVWSISQAYKHTIVTGNDGFVINRLPNLENERENVAFVCREQAEAWFNRQSANKPWKLVIYAHGGLNSESDSITRIRVMGPNFENNDTYPIFTTWKSGWLEIIGNMLADAMNDIFRSQAMPVRGIGDFISEKWDRALEVASRHILAKSMWSEMKENVCRSVSSSRGINLMAEEINNLNQLSNGKLEIHLIGHSAGSFVCGRLLKELHKNNLSVNTCTLYAPACDIQFALDHFKEAVDNSQLARKDFRVHVLSDEVERDDSVGPYRKSLLYLVCRALEKWHKTPILGLANAFDKKHVNEQLWHTDAVQQVKIWQKFFWGNQSGKRGFADDGKPTPGGNLFVLSDKQVNTGPKKIKSSHGCFDNSIDILTRTLEIILKGRLKKKIKDLSY